MPTYLADMLHDFMPEAEPGMPQASFDTFLDTLLEEGLSDTSNL